MAEAAECDDRDLLKFLKESHQRKAFLRDAARRAANAGDLEGVWAACGYRPHATQAAFHASDAPRRVWLAGRRSGKTVGCAMESTATLLRGADDGRGATRVLIVGPIGELAERSFRVVKGVLRQLGFEPARMSDTPVRREMTMGWGSSLVCRSAAGPEALLGESFDLVVMDECARMPSRVWESDVEPSTLDVGGRVIFASTPTQWGWFSDLWDRCQDPEDTDWEGFHCETLDNPHLPKHVRRLVMDKKKRSPLVYLREYCARFVQAEGQVYSEFDEARHVTPAADLDPREPIGVSFDFGCTQASPFVCLVLQWIGDTLRVTHEFVLASKTTTQCAFELKAWWQACGLPTGRTVWATGDISALDARRTLQDQLRDSGILPGIIETRPQEVSVGIEQTRDLLSSEPPRLLVHPRCVVTRREFLAYSWHQPTTEGVPESKVLKRADHCMDALRYAVFAHEQPRSDFMQLL